MQENEDILKEMKNDATKDQYDVKRFEQVLAESYMMVPDSKKRLHLAINDLAEFLQDQNSLDKGGEWYVQADKILNDSPISLDGSHIGVRTNVEDLAENETF